MAGHKLIASLTFISIAIATASNAHAELASDINSLTIKRIERATTANERNNPDARQSTNNPTVRSMQYVRMGWEAQKHGDDRNALILYYKAVKVDKTNAYAFMAAGNLLGEREEGIVCMRAAMKLFRSQGNQEGYKIAAGWLEERGMSD